MREKNITMRSNQNKDMTDKLVKKFPDVEILKKGIVCDNFGCGGFKYYQHFWCRIRVSNPFKVKKK
jgi:hypothetical protein